VEFAISSTAAPNSWSEKEQKTSYPIIFSFVTEYPLGFQPWTRLVNCTGLLGLISCPRAEAERSNPPSEETPTVCKSMVRKMTKRPLSGTELTRKVEVLKSNLH